MKKKLLVSIFLIGLCLGSIFIVYDEGIAKTSQYTLIVEQKDIALNEEFYLPITIQSDKRMESVSAYVHYDSSKLAFIESEDKTVIGSEGILYLHEDFSEPILRKVFQIPMKAIEEGNANISVEDAYIQEADTTSVIELATMDATVHVYKNKTKNVKSLVKDIQVYPGELSSAFHKQIKEYTVNLSEPVKELILSVQPVDENTIIEVNGNENLKSGQNIITIRAIGNEGEEENYKIKVIQ